MAAALCAAAAAGYYAGSMRGREQARSEALEERAYLQQLNRDSIVYLDVREGPIYVIGHKSPDSDTVCSAIAFAGLLNQLGYQAEAAVTEPVNHETAYILKEAGLEAPPVLYDAAGKNIFLVDHSEYAQAADGMKDAHIVGILDHHGIGSVSTGNTVMYEAKPIGATATIVWLDHMNYGVEIGKTNAYLMLGAILSDTGGLSSTLTTETDRNAVRELARLAGVTDVDALYKNIHAELLSYEGMSSEEIVFSDYKEYEESGTKFGIGVVNAIDEETAAELAARLKEVLPACMEQRDVDLMYLSVGMRENGAKIDRIVPADEKSKEVIEAAFPNYDEYDGTSFVFRSGMGRKSSFVPGLSEYLGAFPRE